MNDNLEAALQEKADKIRSKTLSSLVAQRTYKIEACGITFDYSKNYVDSNILESMQHLLLECDFESTREKMFNGEHINLTEDRAVLHTALRSFTNKDSKSDLDILVQTEIEKVFGFCKKIHESNLNKLKGSKLRYVVNIGIGGSDLGPKMVATALDFFKLPDAPELFFVSNIDGRSLNKVLEKVTPDETLFVISSKTFTTQETMTNAQSAKDWLIKKSSDQQVSELIASHFCAITTNIPEAERFGIPGERCFGFWDWVGGRYSLWSAIGISIVLRIGEKNFLALLKGAAAMDSHFRSAPTEENLPVMMGLLGVWYNWFWNAESHAVIPYSDDLADFPAFLQQLDMESNGKGVHRDGNTVKKNTGQIIWGEPGTNGQHAFFQLLHQGTRFVPVDFIVPLALEGTIPEHHKILVANALAQSQALMEGKSFNTAEQELLDSGMTPDQAVSLAAHKTFPGNRVSNVLLLHRLDPYTLGALISAYEHKVFVQGCLYDVNSFDQYGVELGKVLAKRVLKALHGERIDADQATTSLVEKVKRYL